MSFGQNFLQTENCFILIGKLKLRFSCLNKGGNPSGPAKYPRCAATLDSNKFT
jgi:hypothetical protein